MTKIILLALLVSAPLFAQEEMAPDIVPPAPEVITEEVVQDTRFNPRKNHWLMSFGFEGTQYDVPYNFPGDRETFSPKGQEIYGGRLGIGGQLYLGGGLFTTTKLEGYYMGTLFNKVLNGGPDSEDVEFAYTKTTSQLFGIEASQQLGYMFDMKTKNPIMGDWSRLTVEPFIEAGIGRAQAYNRVNYQYDTGTAPTAARERYKDTINDTLSNVKVGGGVNFTSSEGYFFFMKVTFNKFDVIKRNQETYSQPNGQVATITKNNEEPDLDQMTVYALGGGYKF